MSISVKFDTKIAASLFPERKFIAIFRYVPWSLLGMALAFSLIAGSTSHAQEDQQSQPSFDCSAASIDAERITCADPELASLDRQIADAYRTLKNRYESNASYSPMYVDRLLQDQRQWIRLTRSCEQRQCIEQWDRFRLGALQRELSVPERGQMPSRPTDQASQRFATADIACKCYCIPVSGNIRGGWQCCIGSAS